MKKPAWLLRRVYVYYLLTAYIISTSPECKYENDDDEALLFSFLSLSRANITILLNKKRKKLIFVILICITCIKLSSVRLVMLISLILSVFFVKGQKDPFKSVRMKMVEDQIISRGITDEETLRAMREVPRHLFLPAYSSSQAYNDGPMPIGYGQTISQPFIVAYMTEVSEPSKGKRALEIGTGSGYQAAVLAEIVDTVYTIEIVPELAKESIARLKVLGYNNIIAKYGDGYKGWQEHAPFDIIIVTAAADHIPQPLIDQLAEGGRLVMPVGDPRTVQELILLIKKKGRVTETRLAAVRFVPLKRLK